MENLWLKSALWMALALMSSLVPMGHSALHNRIMRGTYQNLVRLAPCSVLVVR